ncbi:MAG: hypothetical protein Q7R93_04665, partial [bacterium]|nr:hypothetical protein [bacterium]
PPTPVTVLSPDSEQNFWQGQLISIVWSGGEGKVQIGLVDDTYETDYRVLGWISLGEKPSGSLVWDGKNVSDITGTVSQSVVSLSKGPYKIIAVSVGSSKNFCVLPGNACNYDVSNAYFSIISPDPLSTLHVTCAPNTAMAQTGEVVTWEATTTNGVSPYVYRWSGTDAISALPTRSFDGKSLDVIYYTVASPKKTAGVTVHDATGKQGVASCNKTVTVTAAPPPLTILSPKGGESFVLTKTADPSQFMRVSWRSNRLPTFGKEKLQIVLQDMQGRSCNLNSVSRSSYEAFVGLVDGYVCPNSNWALSPGRYTVKVYLEGREATMFATSDSYITLTAPISDAQLSIPSASVINSGGSVSFRFLFPSNTIRGSLYVFCPDGITATAPNTCNRYIDVTAYLASNTDYTATFVNASPSAQNVSTNFYVYLPNNPNYGRGIPAQVRVLPAPAVNSNSVTVLSPNGGETVRLGEPYVYRFTSSHAGVIDLTLVPYPPIDAGLICQIATAVSSSAGQISFTVPPTGICAQGPAKVISGSYKLLVTLRNGDTVLATDLSDFSFPVSATSTIPQ